jgi:hypothetical protein
MVYSMVTVALTFWVAPPTRVSVTGMVYVPARALLFEPPQPVSAAAPARQSIAMIQRLRQRGAGRLRFLRTRPIIAASEPGSQKVVAVNRLLRVPPLRGSSSMAVAGALVLTVRVSVKGPPPAVMVRLGGANAQDTCAGSVPQVNWRVPV